jgi:hypothetical protein
LSRGKSVNRLLELQWIETALVARFMHHVEGHAPTVTSTPLDGVPIHGARHIGIEFADVIPSLEDCHECLLDDVLSLVVIA